jgi:endonuclease/exonuclease/phosphatase family metal-dependent hydrolase
MEENMGKLRVISWNCRYGLEYGKSNDKKEAVKGLISKADILVLQELTESDFNSLGYSRERSDWHGDDKDAFGRDPLGVAVFCREGFTVKRLYETPAQFRYILPYEISGLPAGGALTLFAVWVKPVDGDYLKPLYNAIQDNKNQKLLSNPSIMIGDFNTFAKDDNGRLDELEKSLKGLCNCAKEFKTSPTFFTPRYGPGADDFCFATPDLPVSQFTIGPQSDWIDTSLSDHCPVFVDFNFSLSG